HLPFPLVKSPKSSSRLYLYGESLALRRELGDIHLIAASLEDFAALAGRQGRSPNVEDPGSWMERAARLLGAAEVLCQMRGESPPASNAEEYARTTDTARAVLGEEASAAHGKKVGERHWNRWSSTRSPDRQMTKIERMPDTGVSRIAETEGTSAKTT